MRERRLTSVLIEALHPLLVKLPDQDLKLEPGCPVELPDEYAHRLLTRVPGKVRRRQWARWARADGSTHLGFVDFFHTDSDGTRWVFVTMPNGDQGVVNLKFAEVVL
jgi:hypothetical protein